MAKKRIRLALIGCGANMRSSHVPKILDDGAVDIVAACDPDRKQASLVSEAVGRPVPYYADAGQMLAKEQLDSVAISSPHLLHYEQVRMALVRKLHVLCEKPLTISSRHSRLLLSLARKNKRILVVSYQRQHQPHQVHARDLIRRGALGQIRGVAAYVTQNWRAAGGWRLDPKMAGGGMFMDTGSHLVAATLWITGLEPSRVSAFVRQEGQKVDMNTVVTIQFRNGALGTLATIGDASVHDERLAIHGSKGCIVFHLHGWRLKSVLLNDEHLTVPRRVTASTPDADFFAWIRNGGRRYEPPEFAWQVARLSEAVYKSQRLKKPVSV